MNKGHFATSTLSHGDAHRNGSLHDACLQWSPCASKSTMWQSNAGFCLPKSSCALDSECCEPLRWIEASCRTAGTNSCCRRAVCAGDPCNTAPSLRRFPVIVGHVTPFVGRSWAPCLLEAVRCCCTTVHCRGSRQDQTWWDEDRAAQLRSMALSSEYWLVGILFLAASFRDRSWIDAAVATKWGGKKQ